MKKCPHCQQLIDDNLTVCPYCHQTVDYAAPQSSPSNPYGDALDGNGYVSQNTIEDYFNRNDVFASDPVSGKSRGVCALLAIFLGGLGVQYFYLGKTTGGILSILLTLVTCGIWEIVALVQGILMFVMDNRAFVKKYVVSQSKFPVF